MQETISHLSTLAEQSHKQGKVDQYIEHLDNLLQLKREVYGSSSSDVLNHLQLQCTYMQDQLCTMLNHQGIVALQRSELSVSLNYLKRAEHYCVTDSQRVSTFNNLACFYRKTGKLRIALNYLQQALTIELSLPQTPTLSDTYLNLCAVFSQLERHDEALQHIYLSIIMLQHELLMKTLTSVDLRKPILRETDSRAESTSQDSQRQLQIIPKSIRLQDRVAVLVVAYHNLGVEMEHLKKSLEARKIYQSALGLAEQNLQKNHQMIGILRTLAKDQKENVQEPRVTLPHVRDAKNVTQSKLTVPRGTLSVKTRRTKNTLYVPVMQLSPPSQTRAEGRFSPISFQTTQQVVRLKSISVNSPLEVQQQRSLRNHSINEESYPDLH